MVKSRAEIQREYRERKKKALGDTYLEAERKRVKGYYVPSSELSKKDLDARNEKKKEGMRKSRAKKKKEKEDSLVIKIDFSSGKSQGGKTRVRNTIKQQRQQIRKLSSENEKMKRKYKALLRKAQRQVMANRKGIKIHRLNKNAQSSPRTPRGKAYSDMLNAGITPEKVPSIRRKLVTAYALMGEIKEASIHRKGKSKETIEAIVSGKILRKYRGIRQVSRESDLNRHRMAQMKTKLTRDKKRQRLVDQQERMKSCIEEFLSRDDNSRVVPDKNEVKKQNDGSMKPKRTLSDYLDNLHQKFCMENPRIKVSRATFCRYRPKHILPVSFAVRKTCLCTKHQNMSLKLKAIKQHTALQYTNNVDTFFSKHTDDDIKESLTVIEAQQIRYSTWKKVDTGDGKKRMKVVEEEKRKEEFIDMFMGECETIRYHISLVQNQYREVKRLKENLDINEMIVQMDFAENYTCSNQSEIQSAYWNPTMVTLHPTVAYYRKEGERELNHKSFVYVSDELGHTCSTVTTFLKDLVPKLIELNPDLKCIHYLSDSPTSQYRNKNMFYIVANHLDLFGVNSTWQYFEAGHGKGPCDGVGAVAKRMADDAVRQGKTTIQDASDFFAWANGTHGAVQYVFVSKDQCEATQNEMKRKKLSPIKGTIKIHSVIGLKDNRIACRFASCFCENCYVDGIFKGQCDGWEHHTIVEEDVVDQIGEHPDENTDIALGNQNNENDPVSLDNSEDKQSNTEEMKLEIGNFVAATYEDSWYIGKIIEIDQSDGEIHINFMKRVNSKGSDLKYRWPASADKLWRTKDEIICNVEEPTPTGSSKRIFEIKDTEMARVKDVYSKRKA